MIRLTYLNINTGNGETADQGLRTKKQSVSQHLYITDQYLE